MRVLRLETTSCDAPVLSLTATAGTNSQDCTFGPSKRRICLNNPTRSCTNDADCGAGVEGGACARAPRCFSGPPIAFRTVVGACIVTTVAGDATGKVNPTTGEVSLTTPTRVFAYLTSTIAHPCPRCIENVCQGGARDGRACRPSASLEQTSLDCPPLDSQFYLALAGTAESSTKPVVRSATDGLFCPGQRNPGAFGRPEVRRIEETGTPAGNLLDMAPHAATMLDVPCMGSTGDEEVDHLADFPGPEATSVAGTVQLIR